MYSQIMQVRFKDGTEEMIDAAALEELISSCKISHFRRADGWVSAEETATRGTPMRMFTGYERRRDSLSRQTDFRFSQRDQDTRVREPVFKKMSLYWGKLCKPWEELQRDNS